MVGNISNFTKIDVLRCFLRLDKNSSRKELSRDLGLGEGTVRTILNLLKSKKLLDSTKKGHFLSINGNDKLEAIFECISMPKIVSAQSLYPKLRKIGIVIRNANISTNLYKIRDMAVKSGADGAVILQYDGKLYAPQSDYQQDYSELEKNLELRNGDALVVAFSEATKNAENGALAIAVELCKSLKSFIENV